MIGNSSITGTTFEEFRPRASSILSGSTRGFRLLSICIEIQMFASMREDARQTEDGVPAKEADVAGREVELVEVQTNWYLTDSITLITAMLRHMYW